MSQDTPQNTETQAAPEAPQAQPVQEERPLDGLPDWAVDLIKDLRKENAARRTENHDLKKKVADAKSLDDFEALKRDTEASIKKAQEENRILRANLIAKEVGIPASLAARLQGETDEEIRKDAESILEGLPKGPAGDPKPSREPRGGMNPGVTKTLADIDPAALAAGVPRG